MADEIREERVVREPRDTVVVKDSDRPRSNNAGWIALVIIILLILIFFVANPFGGGGGGGGSNVNTPAPTSGQ